MANTLHYDKDSCLLAARTMYDRGVSIRRIGRRFGEPAETIRKWIGEAGRRCDGEYPVKHPHRDHATAAALPDLQGGHMTTKRRRIVEGIWNCISLLHKSGRLPAPTVELLVLFGRDDLVTEEEALDVVTAPRAAVSTKKEQAA